MIKISWSSGAWHDSQSGSTPAIARNFYEPIRAVCCTFTKFYGIHPESILIAHDELDIPVGSIKLKTGGGHGGHNGLKDIVPHIGADFHRLRIGIGRPMHSSQVSGHVLSKPSADDRISITAAIDCAVASIHEIILGDMERARNQINGFR